MLSDFRILASCCAFVVGTMVVWANPQRRLNRAFFVFSLFVAAWLFCQWRAGGSSDGLWWVRVACAVAVGVVLTIWFVKETACNPDRTFREHLRGLIPWAVLGAALVWICFTPYFVPHVSTDARRLYGWGYVVYILAIALMFLALFVQSLFQMRRLSGVRRLELQLLLQGSIAAAIAVVTLMILGALTGNSAFNRAQSVFVLAFYVITSWAIATTKVLDAGHMLVAGAAKIAEVILTALFAWAVYEGASDFSNELVALFIAAGSGLWLSSMVGPVIRRALRLNRTDADARNAAYGVSRHESRPEQLRSSFVAILKNWAKTDRAMVFTAGPNAFIGSNIELNLGSMELETLRELRWITPERLARERSTPARHELARLLAQHELGVLVIGEGLALTTLVGVGVATSRRPFTFPQVSELMELASIIESALERAYFSVKVQHAEQLATVGLMGASLAHEIRNPLVSIKTFVQLLPSHYQDARFREKFFGLIGDEVMRIDRLTEQLLDLASPRVYTATEVELHRVIQSGFDLVASKADGKGIDLRLDLRAAPDLAWTDPAAVKQVLLNICLNAIQAVETQGGERWVQVATRNTPAGIEMSVSDSGLGITEEMRPRLFQPFQSTKSSGFGLGLAICKDILGNLDATISVDSSTPNCGAIFRVVFPCQPL